MKNLADYRSQTKGQSAKEIVAWAMNTFGLRRIILASSFSIEDQALTHMAHAEEPRARVFTLDTGRHFQATYDVWQESVTAWHINYEVGAPDPNELAHLVAAKGPNLFYTSAEARKECCAVRKTGPLNKILSTVDAWIVGLRSEQAATRAGLSPIEWDDAHNVYRISPLCNWSEEQVLEYTKENRVPISTLYSQGFRSIGCAPCTRAIGPKDDVRAGRWWWEAPEQKECGLHMRQTSPRAGSAPLPARGGGKKGCGIPEPNGEGM